MTGGVLPPAVERGDDEVTEAAADSWAGTESRAPGPGRTADDDPAEGTVAGGDADADAEDGGPAAVRGPPAAARTGALRLAADELPESCRFLGG